LLALLKSVGNDADLATSNWPTPHRHLETFCISQLLSQSCEGLKAESQDRRLFDHLRLVVSICAAWHIELVSSANNYLVHEAGWCSFLYIAMSGDDRFEQQVAVPKKLIRNVLRFDHSDTKGLLCKVRRLVFCRLPRKEGFKGYR